MKQLLNQDTYDNDANNNYQPEGQNEVDDNNYYEEYKLRNQEDNLKDPQENELEKQFNNMNLNKNTKNPNSNYEENYIADKTPNSNQSNNKMSNIMNYDNDSEYSNDTKLGRMNLRDPNARSDEHQQTNEIRTDKQKEYREYLQSQVN